MTELVTTDQSFAPPSILDAGPKDMVSGATAMANVLKDVVESQKMYHDFKGKKHVTAEGWATLGSMLGILPVEKYVKKIEGGYEAYISLVNNRTGKEIGGASNICTRAEGNWKNRDDYAIRSMAITRATGKAYRLSFAWIMSLAGYQPTPAEEMPIEPPPPMKKKPVKFNIENQAHLDRLNEILDEKKIPGDQHLAIAEHLNGKMMDGAIIDIAINEVNKGKNK